MSKPGPHKWADDVGGALFHELSFTPTIDNVKEKKVEGTGWPRFEVKGRFGNTMDVCTTLARAHSIAATSRTRTYEIWQIERNGTKTCIERSHNTAGFPIIADKLRKGQQ